MPQRNNLSSGDGEAMERQVVADLAKIGVKKVGDEYFDIRTDQKLTANEVVRRQYEAAGQAVPPGHCPPGGWWKWQFRS